MRTWTLNVNGIRLLVSQPEPNSRNTSPLPMIQAARLRIWRDQMRWWRQIRDVHPEMFARLGGPSYC